MDCLIGLGWNVLPFVCIRKCRLKASDGIFADAVCVSCRFARPRHRTSRVVFRSRFPSKLKVINNPLFILYFYIIKNFIPAKVPAFITLFSLDFFAFLFCCGGGRTALPLHALGLRGGGFFYASGADCLSLIFYKRFGVFEYAVFYAVLCKYLHFYACLCVGFEQ